MSTSVAEVSPSPRAALAAATLPTGRRRRRVPYESEHAASARVEHLLDPQEMEFRIAQSGEEYRGAFRRVYESYVAAGLAEPSQFRMRVTPWQLLSTTQVFIAVSGGETIATVSLVCDGELGLPLEAVYGEEVAWLRNEGLLLAEVSCLADHQHTADRSPARALRLMSLMVQCAQRQGVNHLLIAVHPRHAKFYRRFTAFEPIGGLRSYQAVRNRPAVALALDLDRAPLEHPELYRQFFAARFPDSVFRHRPMSSALQAEFEPVVEASYDVPSYCKFAMSA